MTDPDAMPDQPEHFTDLPIQPTGSGVADLEIAYEQMKLAEQAERGTDMPAAKVADLSPVEFDRAATESAAHPS